MSPERQAGEADAVAERTVAGFELGVVLARDVDGITLYAAFDEQTAEQVIVRLAAAVGDPAVAARLERDARLLADLKHPSLPTVRAVGRAPEGVYVVTAEPRGRSLAAAVQAGLPRTQAVRMLGDVARALDTAHTAGLLHRRVRPASIVVGEWVVMNPKLVSFALGRAPARFDAGPQEEQTPYASPEELRGERAGPAADRYAFACTVFEILAGAPPFDPARQRAVDADPPPPGPRELRRDLPAALKAVFGRALAESPDERPSSAAEFVSLVAGALSEPAGATPVPRDADVAPPEPVATPVPDRPSSPRKPGRLRRASRVSVPLGACAAVIAVAGLAGVGLGAVLDGEAPAPARRAAVGPLSARLPDGWTDSRSAAQIGTLKLERPLAIAPPSGGGGMVADVVSSESAVLDPHTVAEAVDGSPPRPTAVRLGALEAVRWQGLRSGAPPRTVDLFVAPTNAGALTVACYGRATVVPRGCHGSAGSVRLTGAKGYSPVGAASWRADVRLVIDRLRRQRSVRVPRLQRATSPAAQARAATALAGLHATAVRTLGRTPAPPQATRAQRRLVDALRDLRRAYAALGRAARARARRAHGAAADDVRRQERRLRRALESI